MQILFAQGIMIDGVYVLATLAGAGSVIAYLFHALISSKDREFALVLAARNKAEADQESVKKSYQEIAAEALKSATETTNYYRAKEGKPPLVMVAPVVSESHSPSTAAQREAAAIQTMRATMAKIKDATGQEPRAEPEHAQEEGLAQSTKTETSAIKDAAAAAAKKIKTASLTAVDTINKALDDTARQAVDSTAIERLAEAIVVAMPAVQAVPPDAPVPVPVTVVPGEDPLPVEETKRKPRPEPEPKDRSHP